MGVYDTYTDPDSGASVQLKIDVVVMNYYNVGDVCPLPDGVYLSYEGLVGVRDQHVVLVTTHLVDKYGEPLDVQNAFYAARGRPTDVQAALEGLDL